MKRLMVSAIKRFIEIPRGMTGDVRVDTHCHAKTTQRFQADVLVVADPSASPPAEKLTVRTVTATEI